MKSHCRSVASWRELIAEAERSGSVSQTARRHQVNVKTLSWWRWKLKGKKVRRTETRAHLLPVVFAAGQAPGPDRRTEFVELEMRGGIVVRVPVGSDVSYVAALAFAVHSKC